MKPLVKMKTIYVIMLLLIPALLLTVNLKTEAVRAETVTMTSNPRERYIINDDPPVFNSLTILYDTSGDGIGPWNDDFPFINASWSDDGDVVGVVIEHTSGGPGGVWIYTPMTQSVSNESYWSGSLTSYTHGVTVLWYLTAEDDNGFYTHYPVDNTFEYTIINREPVVEITSPTTGANITADVHNITWTAYDLDNDILTYAVSYSVDNTSWQLIQSGITDTFYLWNVTSMLTSDEVQIRIVADDGYGGETADETQYFTITRPEIPSPTSTGSFLVLVLSLVVLTSTPLYLKKQRRK